MRLVIAEDEVLLRDGIARLTGTAGHTVVGQVGDARSLVGVVQETRPDLVITDIRMPPDYTDEGARAAVLLRRRFPSLAVLVLSQVVEPRLASLFVGQAPAAFGYLLKVKVLDTATFLEVLAAVGRGETVIDETVIGGRMQASAGRLAALTDRETDVLRLVASGRSNAGIAAELVISRRTVDAHLRSIFHKLGITADPEGNQRVLATLDWLASATDG